MSVTVLSSSQRKEDLIQALAQYQLELRNDSELCASFIAHGICGDIKTADKIAEKMAKARYLHEYSNHELGRAIAINTRDFREANSRAKYSKQDFLSLLHRSILMTTWTSIYPDVWPWVSGHTPSEWKRQNDASELLMSGCFLEQLQETQRTHRRKPKNRQKNRMY